MLYVRLAIDNIFSQFKRFFLSILLIVISLVVVIYLITLYKGEGYAYNTADKILSQGFEDFGVVTIDYESLGEDVDKFIKDVYDREEISVFGGMNCYSVDMTDEIYNIQKENTEGFFVAGSEAGYNLVAVVDIQRSAMNMCEFELASGIKPEELKFGENNDENYQEVITYLYLGSAYSSIPVGTEYRETFTVGDITYSYVQKVAGIFVEEQCWIDPNVFLGMGMEDIDYTLDCTYGVFVVGEKSITNEICIAPHDAYSLTQAIEAVYEVADEYEADIWYKTLEEMHQESREYTELILSYFSDALLLIIPAMIIMLITMQIASIRHELNTYGIMCSLGYNLVDINIILIIKNVIMAVVSECVAIPIVMYLFEFTYREDYKKLMGTLMFLEALPVAIIIMVIVMFITSATTVIMLKHYTPVKLMEKRN